MGRNELGSTFEGQKQEINIASSPKKKYFQGDLNSTSLIVSKILKTRIIKCRSSNEILRKPSSEVSLLSPANVQRTRSKKAAAPNKALESSFSSEKLPSTKILTSHKSENNDKFPTTLSSRELQHKSSVQADQNPETNIGPKISTSKILKTKMGFLDKPRSLEKEPYPETRFTNISKIPNPQSISYVSIPTDSCQHLAKNTVYVSHLSQTIPSHHSTQNCFTASLNISPMEGKTRKGSKILQNGKMISDPVKQIRKRKNHNLIHQGDKRTEYSHDTKFELLRNPVSEIRNQLLKPFYKHDLPHERLSSLSIQKNQFVSLPCQDVYNCISEKDAEPNFSVRKIARIKQMSIGKTTKTQSNHSQLPQTNNAEHLSAEKSNSRLSEQTFQIYSERNIQNEMAYRKYIMRIAQEHNLKSQSQISSNLISNNVKTKSSRKPDDKTASQHLDDVKVESWAGMLSNRKLGYMAAKCNTANTSCRKVGDLTMESCAKTQSSGKSGEMAAKFSDVNEASRKLENLSALSDAVNKSSQKSDNMAAKSGQYCDSVTGNKLNITLIPKFGGSICTQKCRRLFSAESGEPFVCVEKRNQPLPGKAKYEVNCNGAIIQNFSRSSTKVSQSSKQSIPCSLSRPSEKFGESGSSKKGGSCLPNNYSRIGKMLGNRRSKAKKEILDSPLLSSNSPAGVGGSDINSIHSSGVFENFERPKIGTCRKLFSNETRSDLENDLKKIDAMVSKRTSEPSKKIWESGETKNMVEKSARQRLLKPFTSNNKLLRNGFTREVLTQNVVSSAVSVALKEKSKITAFCNLGCERSRFKFCESGIGIEKISRLELMRRQICGKGRRKWMSVEPDSMESKCIARSDFNTQGLLLLSNGTLSDEEDPFADFGAENRLDTTACGTSTPITDQYLNVEGEKEPVSDREEEVEKEEEEKEKEEDDEMGTNISKGLKDRRSRSSTSLYKPKHLRPGKFFTPARITRQERYKLSGSLPNFLDIKSQPPPSDFREREIYAENNNELSKDSKLLEIERFEKESLTRDYSMCISEKSPPPAPPPQLLARSPSTTENENENEKHPVAPKRRLSSSKRNSHNKAAYVTDATFDVTLNKGHGGLGLSISGGKNSEDQSCGLISIKKLFPHQTAWQSGRLLVGDILLAVNGVPLTGLTNFEALEVLRKSANPVTLTVRRSPDSQPRSSEPPFQPKSPESTRPDQFDQSSINQSFSFNKSKISSSSPPASLLPNFEDGPTEFDITLKKVNGSLGFTLRKEEETSILGHFVRALVKEPALSDGRIKPGDRIESVNGVDLSALTHEKAVAFLRQCGEEVQLRLHRDSSQTPVSASALSPTHGYRPPKPILRKEAIEMLSDLKKSESSPSISRQRGKSSQALKEQIKKSGFRSSIDDPDCTDGVETSSLPNDDGSYSFNPFMHDSLVINNPNFGTPRSLDLSQIPDSVASMPPTLTQPENHPEFGDAPSSMPALPPEQSSESTFAYNLPAYQSTHLPTTTKSVESRKLSERSSEHDLSFASLENESKGGLLKWKGIMFTPEDQMDGSKDPSSTPSHSPSPSPSPLHSFDDKQLIKVELTRSWNSRLGFSLTSAKHGEGATISTIHPNSVAAKNGQLQSGDLLVKVNNENVSNMSTSEVIELLRRVRGAVVIYVHRHE